MPETDEEISFITDEVNDIVKDCIEQSIGNQLYQQCMINKWTDSIVENCLTRLCKLAKPFKYIVTCAIMQKNGAGFHSASSCFWDNSTDGCSTVRWENQTMYVIATVFGIAI